MKSNIAAKTWTTVVASGVPIPVNGPVARAAAHSAATTSTSADHATSRGPKRSAAQTRSNADENANGSSHRPIANALTRNTVTPSASASIFPPRRRPGGNGAVVVSTTVPISTMPNARASAVDHAPRHSAAAVGVAPEGDGERLDDRTQRAAQGRADDERAELAEAREAKRAPRVPAEQQRGCDRGSDGCQRAADGELGPRVMSRADGTDRQRARGERCGPALGREEQQRSQGDTRAGRHHA